MMERNYPEHIAYLASADWPTPGTKHRTLTGGEVTWTKTGLIHRAKDPKVQDREEEDWDDFE